MSIARQRLSKNIHAATNTHPTTEESISKQRFDKHTTIWVLLETVFCVLSAKNGNK
jgi:hypothetical protein